MEGDDKQPDYAKAINIIGKYAPDQAISMIQELERAAANPNWHGKGPLDDDTKNQIASIATDIRVACMYPK